MSKIKVAVIGCGAIAQRRHIPEYASNPHVELVAFADPVKERVDKIADTYGGRSYSSLEELLKSEQVDAVSICTPNNLHAPLTVEAANAGAHVLVEKPMATSAAEGEEMIAAAKRNGVYLMVGHNQRLMPPHVKAKEILDSGRLGKVLTFRTSFGHAGPESWSVDGRESWFFRKEEAIMGAMGDLGVHKADFIRYLLNDEVAEIASFISTIHKEGTDVDDNAVCIVRMNSGAIGTLVASWTQYKGGDNGTILWCENGVVKIGVDNGDEVVVELRNGNVETYKVGAMATNEKQVPSGVIDAFVESIVTATPPSISGEEGLRSLKVILTAFESEASKRAVKV